MYPLGLITTSKRAYLAACVSSHEIRVRVSLLNLAEQELSDLTDLIYDGQVNIDVGGDRADRSLTLSLFDPRQRLSFDPDSPADSALYLNRMIKVTYGVWVAGGTGWVDVPVFTGPITKLDRPADELISVECLGKEAIANREAWRPYTIKKGAKKTSAIQAILRERAGESSFDFPDLNTRLNKTISLGRTTKPWAAARKIARSMGKQLYYDGDGVCRLREPSSNVFTFAAGAGGSIMSPVQIGYDLTDFANVVYVKGGQPKGSKSSDPKSPPPDGDSDSQAAHVPDIRWVEMLGASHPLSAARLGRIGTSGGFIVQTIENDKIRSRSEAKRVAKRELRDRVLAATSISFDALPLPFLEPNDLVRVNTDDGAISSRIDQLSLPLRVGENMSVGYLKKVSTSTRRHRR